MTFTTRKSHRSGLCLATVSLLGLAFGFVVPSVAQDEVRIELEIRNTETPDDDYLTWAPTPARIRLAGADGRDRLVVLTNDPPSPVPAGREVPLDGDLVFAESVRGGETATQEMLRLTLPGDGTWREFVVAGRYRRASTRDKDAVMEVHLESAAGPLVHTHAAMVRIRKDARTLTDSERDLFLRAVAELHREGRYIDYVNMHDLAAKGKFAPEFWPDQSHRASAFLAWHRSFLLQFERNLQERFPDVALPYWRMDQPSNLFTSEFMGKNEIGDQAAVPVEFASDNPLAFWSIDGVGLTRFPKDRTSSKELAKFRAEEQTLKGPKFGDFSRLAEGNPHNNGHNWVGIWMQNCMRSPQDPIFWPFHTGFDRLWAKWQHTWDRFRTDGSRPDDYVPADAYDPQAAGCNDPKPNGCVPKGHHLRDTMWPWDGSSGRGVNVKANRPPERFGGPFAVSEVPGLWPESPSAPTPADMIDYAGLAQDRLEMGFAYDDVPYGAAPQPAGPDALLTNAAPEVPVGDLARAVSDPARLDSERIIALRTLNEIDESAVIDRALAVLRDPQDGGSDLDVEAVEILWVQMMFTNAGLLRHDEIHHALRDALRDPRRHVRVAAVGKLAAMGDSAALDALAAALAQPQDALFKPGEAILLLSHNGLQGRSAVVRPFLDNPDPGVRAAAVSALVHDLDSRPRLLAILGDPNEVYEVRAAALKAVANGTEGALLKAVAVVGDESADPLLRARTMAAINYRLRSQDASFSNQELMAVVGQLRRLDLETMDRLGEPAFRALKAVEVLMDRPDGR